MAKGCQRDRTCLSAGEYIYIYIKCIYYIYIYIIPMRAVRLKLYKGSIQSGISWGHQALGMAPQTRNRIRIAMARQMGLQRTGNADIVFDMQPRHKDPDFEAFAAQIKIYRQCFGNWPEHLHRDLDRTSLAGGQRTGCSVAMLPQ